MKLKEALDYIRENGIAQLGTNQLRELSIPMSRAVNRRIADMQRAGYGDAPAIRGFKEAYGEKANIGRVKGRHRRGKYMNLVYQSYIFLEVAKTGSITGAKKYYDNIRENLMKTPYFTVEQMKTVWDAFHRFESEHATELLTKTYQRGIELAALAGQEQLQFTGDVTDVDMVYERLKELFDIDKEKREEKRAEDENRWRIM